VKRASLALPCSPLALLELLSTRPRARTADLAAAFPSNDYSTVCRHLRTLRAARLVRRRVAPLKAYKHRKPFSWRIAGPGRELLILAAGWRDQWLMIERREVYTLAAALAILDRLEQARRTWTQDRARIRAAWPYGSWPQKNS